jgi:hypothetical protein
MTEEMPSSNPQRSPRPPTPFPFAAMAALLVAAALRRAAPRAGARAADVGCGSGAAAAWGRPAVAARVAARGAKTSASELRGGDLIEHGEAGNLWRVVSGNFVRQGMGEVRRRAPPGGPRRRECLDPAPRAGGTRD